MDSQTTPAQRILAALAENERSKAWLARHTQIPLTTLDRRLRGDGSDLTLAQTHAIALALGIPVTTLIPATGEVLAS